MSGYQDSNLGPPAPKAGALTGLRYTPIVLSFSLFAVQRYYIFLIPQQNCRSFLLSCAFFTACRCCFPIFFKSCLTKNEIVYFKKQDSSRHSRLHARNTEFSFNFGNAFEREVCCARQNAAHILRRHT